MGNGLTVLIDALTGELRTAVLEGERAVSFSIHPPASSAAAGDVYWARVRSGGPGGSFLDLGGGTDGFLPHRKGQPTMGDGDLVAVVVRREGVKGKGCRVILADGDVGEPGVESGLIRKGPSPAARLIESVGLAQVDAVVVEGRAVYDELRAVLGDDPVRLHTGATPLFAAYGVEDDLAYVTEPEVGLPGGGRLTIEETAACVAIDIDSGPAAPGRTNREAVPVMVDEIGKRGLNGVIVIDPAGSNDRGMGFGMAEALGRAFERGLGDAEVKGVTRAGLVEIVRRRERESVAATLGRLRSRAYAAIRAAHGAAGDHPGRDIEIVGNVDLTELLARDIFVGDRAAFSERHGTDLHLVTDNAMARGMFDVREKRS